MKDKLVFERNVPVEVSLTHGEGKEIGCWREQQVMFDLADGRLMFVPQSVRDQIRRLEVKPGERFQICKREVDDEGEPCIEWTVSRLASQAHSAVQLIQSAKNASPAPSQSVAANNDGASGHASNEAAPKKNAQARLSFIMQMALQGALDATKAVESMPKTQGSSTAMEIPSVSRTPTSESSACPCSSKHASVLGKFAKTWPE